MKRDAADGVDRRTWLAGCGRTVVLAGITAAVGMLVSRGQIRGCPDEALACASCGVWPRCRLPRAADARDQRARQENR